MPLATGGSQISSSGQIANGIIIDEDVSASAALSYSKLNLAAALAISDLANGTDGELITWDAAGVATTVPAGTAGHVLTSNGAGAAPTFQVGGNLTVRVPASSAAGAEGVLFGSTYEVNNNSIVLRHVDNSDVASTFSLVVPPGATSISSVKVFYVDDSASVLQLFLQFDPFTKRPADGGALVSDNTGAGAQFATVGTA